MNFIRNLYKRRMYNNYPDSKMSNYDIEYDLSEYGIHGIQGKSPILDNSHDSLYSLYSNCSKMITDNDNDKDKTLTDIIDFYTDEKIEQVLMPLPISNENLSKLKSQWNKEFDLKPLVEPKKNIWRRLKQSLPKRSLYDILTK